MIPGLYTYASTAIVAGALAFGAGCVGVEAGVHSQYFHQYQHITKIMGFMSVLFRTVVVQQRGV